MLEKLQSNKWKTCAMKLTKLLRFFWGAQWGCELKLPRLSTDFDFRNGPSPHVYSFVSQCLFQMSSARDSYIISRTDTRRHLCPRAFSNSGKKPHRHLSVGLANISPACLVIATAGAQWGTFTPSANERTVRIMRARYITSLLPLLSVPSLPCSTHIFLPDDQKPRWVEDLLCVTIVFMCVQQLWHASVLNIVTIFLYKNIPRGYI